MRLLAKMSTSSFTLTAVLGLGLFVLMVAQAGNALAHGRFKSANIAPNSTVTTVPATLTITFTEEPTPSGSKLQVLDASGKAVDKGDARFSELTGTVGLGALADGKYTVKFRVYTEDDNGIVDGDYTFTVAKSGTASSGGDAKPQEAISNLPAKAPATGQGGVLPVAGSGNFVLNLLLGLGAAGSVAGAGLWLLRRRASGNR